MTTDEINKLPAGRDIDALICEFMEPKPEPISARELREREPMTDWYSSHYAYSPGGWWHAEIGTDHNMDESRTYRPERDDAAVTWEPAREPSEDIAAAWDVWERISSPTISRQYDGTIWIWIEEDYMGPNECAEAETAPHAICKAALIMALKESEEVK